MYCSQLIYLLYTSQFLICLNLTDLSAHSSSHWTVWTEIWRTNSDYDIGIHEEKILENSTPKGVIK